MRLERSGDAFDHGSENRVRGKIADQRVPSCESLRCPDPKSGLRNPTLVANTPDRSDPRDGADEFNRNDATHIFNDFE